MVGSVVSERAGKEEDVAPRPDLVGQEISDLKVCQGTVRIILLAPELAKVEESDHVEIGQKLLIDEVDIAEHHVVVAQDVRTRDRELDVCLIFLRRSCDAEHRVPTLRVGTFDPNKMVPTGPKMKDRRVRDPVPVEPLDEMDVAWTLRLA
jgi:hypothetical protein